MSEMSKRLMLKVSGLQVAGWSRRGALSAAVALSLGLLPAVGPYAGDRREAPPNMGGYCVTSFQLVGQTPEGKLVSRLTGECVLRHLGPTTLEAWQFITPKDGYLELDDYATFTADNGDTLQANFKGIAEYTSPTSVSFTGTEIFLNGGTGRFTTASGSVEIEGTATFTSETGGIGEFTMYPGTITYKR